VDTILLKYGTYNINNSFTLTIDKMITSDDGTHTSWDDVVPDSSLCIIRGNGCRVFTIDGASVTDYTRIRGFTITNGDATNETTQSRYGGGIYIGGGADPVIEGCIVDDNTASTSSSEKGCGGGLVIFGDGTNPTIQKCQIINNNASSGYLGGYLGYGGDIYLFDASPTIKGNTISTNYAANEHEGFGGGIYCLSTTSLIQGNTISSNTASSNSSGKGGGIFCELSDLTTIQNNVIKSNYASDQNFGQGGGIYIALSDITISGNDISANYASEADTGRGGGICCNGGETIIEHNAIHSNKASDQSEGYGGGIYFNLSIPTIKWNTIYANIASTKSYTETNDPPYGYGGGLYLVDCNDFTIQNNTLYKNANDLESQWYDAGGSGMYISSWSGSNIIKDNIFARHNSSNSDHLSMYSEPAGLEVTYSCFYNPNGFSGQNATLTNCMFQTDPLFVDEYNGDFHLSAYSPCIDAGDPSSDYSNEPEPNGDRINMGAYGNTSEAAVAVLEFIEENDEIAVPKQFGLKQNYPNPFNSTTTIKYGIPEASDVTVKIYNILGQEVKSWNFVRQKPGYYEILWNGTGRYGQPISTGLHLYIISAGDFVKTKKILLLK